MEGAETSKVDNVIIETRMNTKPPRLWPCGDDLDKNIFSLALPAVANFAIVPLVGAVDTFWVGQMTDALALAGQGAANQVFSSIFWVISFLPNVVTPRIATAAGSGDTNAVRERVKEALFVGLFLGVIGTGLLTFLPNYVLASVLPVGAPARPYAEPYLAIRALTFLPALLSTVGFSVYRGSLDVVTPLKITIISNLVNIILDPVLMFPLKMGVAGAAAATCATELVSFFLYARTLVQKGIVQLDTFLKPPPFKNLAPLIVGGLSVQSRAIAMNLAFLAVTRATQALDKTGTGAAAHAITMQLWQLGGVILLAMSSVASVIVPTELARNKRVTDKVTALRIARATANRILSWGVLLGSFLGCVQLACLPLLTVFSPLAEVQQAARLPSMIGAALQIINGVVFIGEGIQQGNQYFTQLAVTTAFASAGMLVCLRAYGHTLAGVWGSFIVFNFVRLLGVLWHHFYDGPLALRNIEKERVAALKFA
jgi:putative MATE family efflux protein